MALKKHLISIKESNDNASLVKSSDILTSSWQRTLKTGLLAKFNSVPIRLKCESKDHLLLPNIVKKDVLSDR